MMRVVAPIICACWIASYSGSAFAQALPPCDRSSADKVTDAGGVPTLVGCPAVDVESILTKLHQRYRVFVEPDPTATGIAPRIITRQEQQKLNLSFYFSTGAGYPPPVVHHPTFTIKAQDRVQEGEPITVAIHQQDGDGQPHHINLNYDHPELMADKAPSFDFDPKKTDEILSVNTVKGRPGDGDHPLTISLESTDEGTSIGVPGSQTVNVVDTEPTTYSIEAPHGVGRGSSMEFTITRHGPVDAAQVESQFDQPNGQIEQSWHPVNFDQNGIALLRLAGESYLVCADPPLVRIRVGNQLIEEAASYSNYVPQECRPKGILQWLHDNVPYWPWPAIPVGALLAFGLWRLARRIFNGGNSGNGTNGDAEMPPPPHLYPTSDIEYAAMPQVPDPPEIPGWPKFSRQIRIEWDEPQPPDPLPIAEPDNG